ncbi:dihydrofolate reductase [Variovorax dokdonensis]|uniref:Dihydrofolate reductase n=1 Tax=Variovorax dokdonensis TaxID=344883 RepID=A0ABT7NC81_9BURK|nr:dihydrofolate reductase [Variovorax dokdonensis]MDM0045538.1 dihydrofolate reductase [Variovorax dokdonensis]
MSAPSAASAPGPRIHLIFARARNGVIGKGGQMPWHLPEDLAHFKRQTQGAPVLMGRKTWDSLPARFRPLPGRRNIVITRQAEWQGEGAERASSLHDAIALCAAAPQLWVIGGGEIYAQALPLAASVVVTEIERDFDGDTFAPQLDASWQEAARSEPQIAASDGLPFSFVTYERHRPSGAA